MADLVLYTNPMSRGRIARWMLEEAGAEYRAEIVEYGPAMKGADYRRVNPMGKVPALVHGEAVVTEAAAICAYVADAFPDAGLAPEPGSAARGAYYRWLFFGAGPVEAAVTNAAFGFEVPADSEGRSGYGSLAAVTDTLEGLVRSSDDYLLGERFSAVDVYLGAQIAYGLRFGTLEARPAFETYAARILGRPAAKRAAETDDALIAARQAES